MIRRTQRLLVASALVLGIVMGVGADAEPSYAQSAGNGLEESSVNTFLVDAGVGVVRVTVDITLRNVTADRRNGNVITQTYFNGYGVVVPAGAENIVATRNGQTLTGELLVDEEGEAFSFYQFQLGTRLFNGQSTSVTVTYEHHGSPPRSELPWRANSAYASFVAFGLGDEGNITINIILPVGYEFDEFTDLEGFEESEPDGFGSITYSRSDLDEEFGTIVSLSNDARLTTTELDVPGANLTLRSWPDDSEWATFATEKIETGVPELEEMIGSSWPLDGDFEIRQTVEPNFYGYAGWFDTEASEIAVGEELDADTMYHELSHAWFNSDNYTGRWLSEGLAELYAAEMVERDGDTPDTPRLPPLAGLGRQPLADWSGYSFDEDTEEYGYNAAFWVMDAIVDEIGFERLAEIVTAAESNRISYTADGAEPETRKSSIVDWRRMLDYFERIGGSTEADALFREYVVPDKKLTELDRRTESIEEYNTLAERIAPWAMPIGLRTTMDIWAFDKAGRLRTEVASVIDVRDMLDEVAESTGIAPNADAAEGTAEAFAETDDDFTEVIASLESEISAGEDLEERQAEVAERGSAVDAVPPPLTDAVFADQVKGFSDAATIADDQIDALMRLATAIDVEASEKSFVEKVGLYDTDVPGVLDDARTALIDGDTDLARSHITDAVDTLEASQADGKTRLTIAAVAVGALLLLIIGLVILLKRRRRKRRASAGRDDLGGSFLDVPADGNVDLDEDALPGASLGGMNDAGDIARTHPGEASGTAGIVQSDTVLSDVGDAVLQLDEHVGTVIDTDPVAGAEVLVDPDAHDGQEP